MSDDFSSWIGKAEERRDVLDPVRSNALAIALGGRGDGMVGAPLPLLHHWLYFWDVRPPALLGGDGHPEKGGFLPPVPLPRRMWAGGRLRFAAPLKLGEEVTKRSTIIGIKAKRGGSGELVFVTVQHELINTTGIAIVEEQDLVYREPATATPAGPGTDVPAPDAAWREQLLPDTVLLFRYSALTMNGHRIHYDRPYAVDEEAYSALVVHGPLQATLLAALAERSLGKPLTGFEFRGQAPAFDGVALHVCADPGETGLKLRTVQGGKDCMVATAA